MLKNLPSRVSKYISFYQLVVLEKWNCKVRKEKDISFRERKKILLLAEKHYFKSLHTKYIMQPDSSRKTYRHIYGSLYYQNKIDDYLKFSSNFQHKVRKEKK